MKRYIFETATQKVARILARQYNIEVVFEGDQAMTDGRKIYLPYFENLTEELRGDLNGYANHEVAHCKFTDFNCMKKEKLKSRFHKELLNAVEDIRIEWEMKKEYPGTAGHLDPLRAKWKERAKEGWAKSPWPMRFMFSTAYEMNGEKLVIDKDTKDHLEATKGLRAKLASCTSTNELRKITAKMVEIVMKKEEEKEEEEKEKRKEEGGKEADGKDGKGTPGRSDKKDKSDQADGEGKEGKGKGEARAGDKSGKSGKAGAAETMMGEGKEADSEWDKHTTDLQDFINEKLKKFREKGELCDKAKPITEKEWRYDFSDRPHIPFSTRFDKIINQTGKGDPKQYMELRRSVQSAIIPTKRALERILKVKENAKWTPERERGLVNTRSLAKLATSPVYRTPFKQFTRTETNNVAIELLVDMSGSMAGKISIAQGTVIALAEALRDLQIPFEVTGFQSTYSRELSRANKGNREIYNRNTERLEHYIFKGFSDTNLTGLEKIRAGYNNVDGESVRWAAGRLAEQKQKRKILMVFSDGQPSAEGNMYILNSDLRRAIERIKKSGIECIGFGICTKAVRHFYPEHVIVENIRDLPGKVMKKLSDLIIRGIR